jgi:thioester reductase-like protein
VTDFLTGYPGFIGRRLVARLLDDDPAARVVALVEPRMLDVARRLAPERLEVVPGDITLRRLGLDDATWARLAGEVRRVFHLAAVYDLAVPLETAQRVNVDGTGNVLELCLAADGLERLVHISTAYVAGRRRGVVYEHELVVGQRFKNHYESTKFQAELWVRELRDSIPTTVLRPAIVVGDSRTGETEKFDGPYYILRSISRLHQAGRPVAQFGRARATFNVVPVDFVVAAIAALAADPAAAGRTLHLVDPHPVTTSELVGGLSRAYADRAPVGRVPARLTAESLRLAPVSNFFGGTPRESIAYLNHPVTFDTRQAVDLLEPHGLTPPPFASYLPAMVGFFRAHEHDPAFRPRRSP